LTRLSTLLGFSTAAASVLAIVVGPVVGALSDRARTRLGKRIPFFLIGVPLVIVALYSIALAPSILVFVFGVLLYRVGDNFIFPAWEALYPDNVPASQRGLAAGMKAFMDILAVLVGRFAAGEIMGRADALGSRAAVIAVTIPVLGMLLALLVTWLTLRKQIKPAPPGEPSIHWVGLRESFRIDWRAHMDFVWWLVNRFLYWTGFVILGTFLLFFVIDVIGLPEADAQRYLGRLSLVLGGAVLLVALPSGRMADRWGRRPMVILACALSALGTGLVVMLRDLSWLSVAAALIGMGAGIYNSANFAQLTDIVPPKEAARFLGLSNIAGASGGALARFLGGALIDPLNALSGDRSTGYLSLYAFAALLFALSTFAAFKLPSGKQKLSS
jgi:MFS family permease